MALADPLTSLLSALNEKASPRACLILCPDQIRQQRVCKRIIASLGDSIEQTRLDGSSLTEDGMRKSFFSLQNISLFSSENILIIQHLDGLNAQLTKILLQLLGETSPSTIVILIAAKLASNSVVLKFFEKRKTFFSLEALSGAPLDKWISKELAQQGIKNQPPAIASSIRQASDESPDTASEIIEKLVLYVDGDTIRPQDLKAVMPIETHVDEFDFISKIATAPRAQLELMIDRLMAQGVSPFPLLALIHKNFASYYGIANLPKRLSDYEISQALSIPPWLVKKLMPLARRYTLEQLEISLAAIVRADSLLKNRSLGHQIIMSELMESLTP